MTEQLCFECGQPIPPDDLPDDPLDREDVLICADCFLTLCEVEGHA